MTTVQKYLDDYADVVSATLSEFLTAIINHSVPEGKKHKDYKFAVTISDMRDDTLMHTVTRNGKVIGTAKYENGRIEAVCYTKPML